jgi:hypothetical protein
MMADASSYEGQASSGATEAVCAAPTHVVAGRA